MTTFLLQTGTPTPPPNTQMAAVPVDPIALLAAISQINTTIQEASQISSTLGTLSGTGIATLAVLLVLAFYQAAVNHGYVATCTSPANVATAVAATVSAAVQNTLSIHLSGLPSPSREPSIGPQTAASTVAATSTTSAAVSQ